MSTSGTQFDKFLAAMWTDTSCKRCGNGTWVFHGEPDKGMDAPLTTAMIQAATLDKYMPVYTIHCKKCGEVHLFSADVVNGWSAANG